MRSTLVEWLRACSRRAQRHHDIGEQQVNRLLAGDPQRVFGIVGAEDLVPLPFEGAPHEGADVLFIVHDENRRHEPPPFAARSSNAKSGHLGNPLRLVGRRGSHG